MAEVGGRHLRAVSLDPLEQEIEAVRQDARRLWASLGVNTLLLEGERDPDAFWKRCSDAEREAIDLAGVFATLAKLSEKREAR